MIQQLKTQGWGCLVNVYVYTKLPDHFPKWMCHFIFTSAVSERSSSSTASSTLVMVSLLVLGKLTGIYLYPVVVLIYISL